MMVSNDSEVILGTAVNIFPSMIFNDIKLISESFIAILL